MKNLNEKYISEVIPEMISKFGYKNKMAVPKINKVVLNIGFGRDAVTKTGDELKKTIEAIMKDLSLISGQKPSLRKSKKSISGFKLRKGIPVGAKVTLRRKRMNDFIDRMIHVALPRSRDFKGLDLKNFDNNGNFSIGIKEHIIFPEVSAENLRSIFGFQVTIKTSSKSKEEGIELLRLLGLPLKKN
jgi:large subunit ribosomal protein L5